MEIPRYWRTQNQRYRLNGETCHVCGSPMIANRPRCIQCSEKREYLLDAQNEYAEFEIPTPQLVSLK